MMVLRLRSFQPPTVCLVCSSAPHLSAVTFPPLATTATAAYATVVAIVHRFAD